MKKSITVIFLALAMLAARAQNYLISFEGAGDTIALNTVKVDNLTSGATATLNGGDILHLTSSLVGLPDIDKINYQIFPNPMTEHSILTFFAVENGNMVMSIVDLSGKTVYQINSQLSIGEHRFRITGLPHGIYIVKVSGKTYHFSTKLVSQSTRQTNIAIEHVSFVKKNINNQLKHTKSTIDMLYKTGDKLLYKGISGRYSTIVPDVPVSSKTITFNFVACTDKDGNNYATVRIGTQLWMAENLKTTKYRNGDPISNVTDSVQWRNLTTGAYCNYKNEPNNSITYGRLYNWVSLKDSRNVCPTGWHVPDDAEWTILTSFLGESVAGNKLKETGNTHWQSSNAKATNETGFTALPGGLRDSYSSWAFLGLWGYWWSSTEYNTDNAYYLFMGYGRYDASKSYTNKSLVGFSVRCLRD